MRFLLKRSTPFLSHPYQPLRRVGFPPLPAPPAAQQSRGIGLGHFATSLFPYKERETQPHLPSMQMGGMKPPEMHRLEVGEEADPTSTSNTTASVIARVGGLVRNTALFLQPAGLPRGFSLWAKRKAAACSMSDRHQHWWGAGREEAPRATYFKIQLCTKSNTAKLNFRPGMETAPRQPHRELGLTHTKGTCGRRAELWHLSHCQWVFGLR